MTTKDSQNGPENSEPRDLAAEVAAKEAEIIEAKAQLESLEQQLAATTEDNRLKGERNGKLAAALRESQGRLLELNEELKRLAQPPNGYGYFVRAYDDGTVDVWTTGREMRVAVSPTVDTAELKFGQKLRLNEALTVVESNGFPRTGEIVTFKEKLEAQDPNYPAQTRAVVLGHADEERVVFLAGPVSEEPKLKAGDSLMADTKVGIAFEKVPKAEVEDLTLEEVPDVRYEDIGGLAPQIEQIRDAVELPFLKADLFVKYKLKAPKGVLIYGPPGCGKTLIAKAVANSLASRLEQKDGAKRKSLFLNIKGPELLNKYVGETERHIRLIFQRARELGSEGNVVVIFFDEMESIFRARGTGISSDVETTIVPQLLTMIDGVEGLENVLVIGASNREDMIDPAILRPGRFDVKIKVERPDKEGATDIFAKYLDTSLPLAKFELESFHGDRQDMVEAMITAAVDFMYEKSDETKFIEVTYQKEGIEVLHFGDFTSGAMIENVVSRAKRMAVKAEDTLGEEGLTTKYLLEAIKEEFEESEDLPNTTNPDDWARISGRKGDRIVYIRTLRSGSTQENPTGGRNIDTVTTTGQYL